jgi:outer membrane protein OmpA-like peptidoglycan-associated protein
MRYIYIIMIFIIGSNLFGQTDSSSIKKRPTLGFHFFYNDFLSARNIELNGLDFVLQNNQLNKPNNMQGGFGIDYMAGLTKRIDYIGTLNASWVNYLLPSGVLYGNNKFLLDINAGFHLKALPDRYKINPFIIAKIGYSKYKNVNGFSFIPGLGFQANFFNETFVFTTIEYRKPLNNTLSPQLYYSFGIAANISKKKIPVVPVPIEPKPIETPKVPEPVVIIEEKPVFKTFAVSVMDEATNQPLQYAEVTIEGEDGNVFNATTNADGLAFIKDLPIKNYVVKGRLNKIDATSSTINKNDFSKPGNQIAITLTHNDPRFTLVGNTIDKTANTPVPSTVVTVTNKTQSSTAFSTSNNSGEFRSQLESGSEFEIVGKKESYISNIENISTMGLNRSATLYVKLQLGIEEAKVGKSIVLNKIYFETGKSELNTSSSLDLQKLVQFLKDNPNTKLEIQGHTDNTGKITTNNILSQNRANSVVNYLVTNGISIERLIAKGYGPTVPIADNTTPEGKAQNRRVEMRVVE